MAAAGVQQSAGRMSCPTAGGASCDLCTARPSRGDHYTRSSSFNSPAAAQSKGAVGDWHAPGTSAMVGNDGGRAKAARMHPRNPYSTRRVDFANLALRHASLVPYLVPSKGGAFEATLNWADPRATVELTKALLWEDFGLHWDLPKGRLCPTLPSRLNYILSVQDLLGGAPEKGPGAPGGRRPDVCGLDIGTGASCIYPLLAYKACGWRMVATDVDDVALVSARNLVERNALAEVVDIRDAKSLRRPGGRVPALLSGMVDADDLFDFCMCNPPFFSSSVEAAADPHPFVTRDASTAELVTEGGEVAFVSQLIRESALVSTQVRWFTVLLGRRASVEPLVRMLHHAVVPPTGAEKLTATAVRTRAIAQGQGARWLLAWSFADTRAQATPGWSQLAIGARRKRPRVPASVAGKPRSTAVSVDLQDAGISALEAVERLRNALAAERLQSCTEAPGQKAEWTFVLGWGEDSKPWVLSVHKATEEQLVLAFEDDFLPATRPRVLGTLERLRAEVMQQNRRWRRRRRQGGLAVSS